MYFSNIALIQIPQVEQIGPTFHQILGCASANYEITTVIVPLVTLESKN